MIEITITQRGPALSVEEMRELARQHAIYPTASHLSFLVKMGNGGYVDQDVALPTPVASHPEFEVHQFNGIGHPSPYLDLIHVVESYRIDDQLPPRHSPRDHRFGQHPHLQRARAGRWVRFGLLVASRRAS